ncbi:hypothetical protein, partial [Enterococcus faecium]|uniref:hypothetical protein n=1 Tax=Enterococcus faecium TaxID=1352 RepID=UPI00292CEF80
IVGSLEDLFVDREVTRFQLTTSYRSTKEITDFANHFIVKEHQDTCIKFIVCFRSFRCGEVIHCKHIGID